MSSHPREKIIALAKKHHIKDALFIDCTEERHPESGKPVTRPASFDCWVLYMDIQPRETEIQAVRQSIESALTNLHARQSYHCRAIACPGHALQTGPPIARELVWLENSTFAAWGCSTCGWIMTRPGPTASERPPTTVKEAFN